MTFHTTNGRRRADAPARSFIRRYLVPEGGTLTIPATTTRYINGEYVTTAFDPDDPTEQVFRPEATPSSMVGRA